VIVNCTPHPLRLYHLDHDEVLEEIPPSGQVARVGQIDLGTQILKGCDAPVEYVEFHHVNGLPGPKPDTWYVVSLATALASHAQGELGRGDLLVPYLEVRNEAGTVVGCRMLARPV
jgi:hypothetical protein